MPKINNNNNNNNNMKFKIILAFLMLMYAYGFYVTVPTGSVLVTYNMKVLQNYVSEPGFNLFNPFTQRYQIVDVTSQEDTIKDIKCISLDKQEVTIPYIKVWNQLPKERVIPILSKFDKPYHETPIPYDRPLVYDPVINYVKETCSEYTGEELRSDKYRDLNEMVKGYLEEFQKNRVELNGDETGLIILKVFVEVPRLSKEVESNHQEIAVQKTRKAAEAYRQEAELKEKETKNKIEILEAEKKRDVAAVDNDKKVREEEAESRIQKIRADSEADQKRIGADAESYAVLKKAADNEALLTREYLQLKQLETFGNNKVIYYGEKIPNYLVNQYTAPNENDAVVKGKI